MQYIIDARRCENEETNFLTLGLWGKTCSEYVVDALSQIVDLDRIVYITNDSLLAHIIRRAYPTIHIKNDVDAELLDEICLLNGRCPLLRSETIKTVVDCFKQGGWTAFPLEK